MVAGACVVCVWLMLTTALCTLAGAEEVTEYTYLAPGEALHAYMLYSSHTRKQQRLI